MILTSPARCTYPYKGLGTLGLSGDLGPNLGSFLAGRESWTQLPLGPREGVTGHGCPPSIEAEKRASKQDGEGPWSSLC